MTSSEDKDREVWGRYLAAYREAHPNAGIPGACLTIDALRVFERNARSSCADTVATPEEWTAISRLLNVAQKATFAMEDSEETGEGHIVPNEQAVELSAALDALEELPAAPGYASGARSNAAYALRRLLHPKASAAPESETPKLRTCAKCGLKASHVADCTADGCPMLEPSASSASAASKTFPIMYTLKDKPGPTQVPWFLADMAYSVYAAKYGNRQTLQRLKERGGFWAGEMDSFLPDWRERAEQWARSSSAATVSVPRASLEHAVEVLNIVNSVPGRSDDDSDTHLKALESALSATAPSGSANAPRSDKT